MKHTFLLILTLAIISHASTVATNAASLIGPCSPSATYDPACDVDHDGNVDIVDIQLTAGHWNQAGTWTGGDGWALTGNAGTNPATNFVGTTDGQDLIIQPGAGRVGVGTTSPADGKVHVAGDGGLALYATSMGADAVHGEAAAASQAGVRGTNSAASGIGVRGEANATGGVGVWGQSNANTGVYGLSSSGSGVWGQSTSGDAVYAVSTSGAGVLATSQSYHGVLASTNSANFAAVAGINLTTSVNGVGVYGSSTNGPGVSGSSETGNGIKGVSDVSAGVYGVSTSGSGLYGSSTNSNGVYGQTAASNQPGVRGVNAAASGIGVRGEANAAGGVGVWGQSNINTGVYGLSTSGIGVWGQSTTGPAMRADGNAVQAADKGGWVKAMAAVGADGTIFSCYNGLTGASNNGCGFSVNHWTAGGYGIDVGFYVRDRFVSITPARRACFFFGDCNVGANYDFPDSDNVINVRIFENTQADETTDGDFMIIVF